MPQASWFSDLQAFGIIAGLFVNAYNIHRSWQAQKVANLLQIGTAYRDIWKQAFTNPALHDVLRSDITKDQLTENHRLFVKMLIHNAFNVFAATQFQLAYEIEGMQRDLQDFLCRPIPELVWAEIKPYQNAQFVAFVEGRPYTRTHTKLATIRSMYQRLNKWMEELESGPLER